MLLKNFNSNCIFTFGSSVGSYLVNTNRSMQNNRMNILDEILNDIPYMKEEKQPIDVLTTYHWQLLDSQNEYYLVCLNVNEDYNQQYRPVFREFYRSEIFIVKLQNNKFELYYHIESFHKVQIAFFAYSENKIIVVQNDEYVEDFQGGHNGILVIDFENKIERDFIGCSIGYGNNFGGDSKIAYNKMKNWIVVCRNEGAGWKNENYDSIIYIIDVSDFKLLFSFTIPEKIDVNSIDIPGAGNFIVLTNYQRDDYVYKIEGNKLIKITNSTTGKQFKISISFAGEDRHIAELLAIELKNNNISVFYDQFNKSALWGKDLIQYLFDVYSNQSEYCIPLISKYYKQKSYTKLEMKAMQSKSLTSEKEYILPICLDETNLSEIPGLPPQIGYIHFKNENIKSIISIIIEKLAVK